MTDGHHLSKLSSQAITPWLAHGVNRKVSARAAWIIADNLDTLFSILENGKGPVKEDPMQSHQAKKITLAALLLILLLALTACGSREDTEAPPQDEPPASSETQTPPQQPDTPDTNQQEAILYIGTKDEGFAEYPMTYEGNLTPEKLIAGIADLTGWDLTLAEDVTTGKGGMSVCFAKTSALFAGPPEPQNEDFFMFSAEQLAQTLLDSVQKTLQMGFTGQGGDPDALDIYYYMEGEQPLELPDIGKSWPLDQTYTW